MLVISSKHIDKISLVVMAFAVLISMIAYTGAFKKSEASHGAGTVQEYERKIFDANNPVAIDIIMDADKWSGMLENASKKQWTNCDVVINGARFHNVGIRTKGDSSLSSVAEVPDCNRYSFKLQFDKYTKGQLCWGLDKLCLNNNYGDATNMKEAFVYDMFKYLGADASMYNFASVSVNGDYWGAYLALEAAEDSFLARNYGRGKGALYKPGSEKGLEDEWEWDEYETLQSSEGNSVTGGEETFSWDDADMDNGGADLNYIDDNLDSYPGIFSCNVNKTTKANHRRVVEALKNISQKRNLEKYMDMENLLRYMAAHNFSVNNDSLSGDGAHNYYL